MPRVFVYGTLMRNGYYHRLIDNGITKFLGSGNTVDEGWEMRDLSGCPALARNPNGANVIGEVYEVDEETMRSLDRLEGYPQLYHRMEVEVALAGEECTCWCWLYYVGPNKFSNRPLVPNNDWAAHVKSKD